MEQTREELRQNLAERLCWQEARRDDSRMARRLYRKQVVDGVYQLDAGALLDDFFYFLQELGERGRQEMAEAMKRLEEQIRGSQSREAPPKQ
ncbi:MAG: hypothetical protein ACREOH_21895 [Candidatus Entotheonellia bacterium]